MYISICKHIHTERVYIYIFIQRKTYSGMSKNWVYLLNDKLLTGKMLIIQWILGQPVFKQNICVNLSTNT